VYPVEPGRVDDVDGAGVTGSSQRADRSSVGPPRRRQCDALCDSPERMRSSTGESGEEGTNEVQRMVIARSLLR
jgi:hypothetical protein